MFRRRDAPCDSCFFFSANESDLSPRVSLPNIIAAAATIAEPADVNNGRQQQQSQRGLAASKISRVDALFLQQVHECSTCCCRSRTADLLKVISDSVRHHELPRSDSRVDVWLRSRVLWTELLDSSPDSDNFNSLVARLRNS